MIYLEAELHEVMAFESSVRAGHGNDFSLFHQQVFWSVQSTTQQLKGPELLLKKK